MFQEPSHHGYLTPLWEVVVQIRVCLVWQLPFWRVRSCPQVSPSNPLSLDPPVSRPGNNITFGKKPIVSCADKGNLGCSKSLSQVLAGDHDRTTFIYLGPYSAAQHTCNTSFHCILLHLVHPSQSWSTIPLAPIHILHIQYTLY